MKNRIVAVFFAFFGGVLGLHRMYLRGFNAGSGRLIFFFLALFLRWPIVLVILSVIAVVEGILLVSMEPAAFDAKYNKGKAFNKPFEPQSSGKSSGRTASAKPARRNSIFFSNASKWMKSGTKKFRDYDMKGALADFLQAVEIAPNNPSVHFNLACTYAILEEADKGFYHLEQAVACGFKDIEKIGTHDSLAFLRIQPQYPDFVVAGYRVVAPKSLEAGDDGNLLENLRRITELRQQGAISESDFLEMKEKLMR